MVIPNNFTTRKGWYNRRLVCDTYQEVVKPRLHGHSCIDQKKVCGAVGQAQYVCECGTKSSADERSSTNIQSTSHNCWLKDVFEA
jgi:hypothetical protein